MAVLPIDIGGDRCQCGPACSGFLAKWEEFWQRHAGPEAPPVAIMECAGYYDGLRPKSRSMVRQASRRYVFRECIFNDVLDDVTAINRSKTITSEGPMRGWYTEPARPLGEMRWCPIHWDVWYGGFDADGVLRGYCRLVGMNELAVIHDIFSHRDGATGVLNGLLAHMAEHAGVRYISYHTMEAGSAGRQAFKERTGFHPVRLSIS